jgi:hypothetical protein
MILWETTEGAPLTGNALVVNSTHELSVRKRYPGPYPEPASIIDTSLCRLRERLMGTTGRALSPGPIVLFTHEQPIKNLDNNIFLYN